MKKQKKKKTDKQNAMDLADMYFSRYVRLKWIKDNVLCAFPGDGDDYIRCIICNNWFYWKNIDCGHFISRDCHSTKYELKNTAPQCRHCNSYAGSKQYEFGLRLDEIHGKGTADEMLLKSKIPGKITEIGFREIAKEYRLKIKALK